MKAWPIVTACLLMLLAQGGRATELEDLIAQLKKTKNANGGISQEAEAIAKKIQAKGPEAILLLLPLLKDPDSSVRDAGAYTLRDIEGLKEEHLDALIDAYQREGADGWLPGAIARVGTTRAIDFLFAELLVHKEELSWAISRLGPKAIPRLVETLKMKDGWDDHLASALDIILRDLGPNAVGAIDTLVGILNDETLPLRRRIHAAYTLGIMGPNGERGVPELLKRQNDTNHEMRRTAIDAIVRMRVEASVPFLLERFKAEAAYNYPYILCNIAEIHTAGKKAGPTMMKYLASNNTEIRACAARTLGYIGYREGGPELIRLLTGQEDWRVTLSAAEALGKLGVKEALPALTKVSQEHWYPPVRAAALSAAIAIRDGGPPKPEDPEFLSEFFGFRDAGSEMETITEEEAESLKLPVAPSRLPRPDLNRWLEKNGHGFEHYCGVEIEGGYLLGRAAGEFGGEIKFIDRHGRSRVVMGSNTEAIYQTPAGVVAVTGVPAHENEGAIYRLEKDRSGHWQGHRWRTLPGTPRFSRLLQDGRIFVNCIGGMVAISPSGEIQFLTRSDVLGER